MKGPSIKACLTSMRLRTLPLSLSGIMMGIGTAYGSANYNAAPLCIAFLILTACFLQILSNLSNELGDILHGTDSAERRQGMHYSIMDGEMSVAQMKILIGIILVLCIVSGLIMIWSSFGSLFTPPAIVFIVLGACAILAAMKYTLGSNPYGYRGLGDIFVFVFFGLATTLGAYYLTCHDPHLHEALLSACATGLFSVGVLNVNNIRDMDTDKDTRKTVAIRLGEHNARIYQTILICAGWACMIARLCIDIRHFGCLMLSCLVCVPLFALHLAGIWKKTGKSLDSMLPLLVMSTFLLSLIYMGCIIVSS